MSGTASGPASGAGRRALALPALALASFAIGTGEFVIVGLVPDLASTLHVSVPSAGLLVSVYALGVAFGSPLVAMGLSAVPRRLALLVLLAVFVVGDGACALAPDYRSLLAARVLTALAHGSFFGIASVVAAELAPPGAGARAVSLLFTGLTVANVVGVPIGTAVGHWGGWRLTFALVAALALASLVAVAIAVPRSPSGAAPDGLRRELAALRRMEIWLSMAVSALSSAGLFTVLTFLAPLLEREAGLAPGRAALALFLFGAGLIAGGLLGGRVDERRAVRAIRILLVVDAVTLLLLALLARNEWAALASVFAWGVAAFALVPPLQHRVLSEAGGSPRLASTLNQSAFNVGDAIGAAFGAFLLAHGAGLRALPIVAAGVVGLALVPASIARSALRSSRSSGDATRAGRDSAGSP